MTIGTRPPRTAWALALGACLVAAGQPTAAAPKSAKGRDPREVAALIDRAILKDLEAAKIPPSPVCDDAEFIRRLSLDLRGRVPTAERVVAFLAETAPDKRARLIDEFLADEEYGDHFSIIWYHRIVQPNMDNGRLVSHNLQPWLAERFNRNDGWDKVVQEILTASGERDQNPAVNFWLNNVEAVGKQEKVSPARVTASASHLFLGVKLECCECHNHPFDDGLKQTDFWGVAAFFGNTHADHTGKKDEAVPVVHEGGGAGKGGKGMKAKDQPKEMAAPPGAIVIPDSKGKTVKAKFFLGEEPKGATGKLRQTFAAWATSPANPFFARAAVNKLWANFFGRGIVNPIDDMREAAKNTHPELLQALAAEFTASGFDQKHLIRCICTSETYQRTSKALPGNKQDEELYSHARVKVMTADMLFDSLGTVLDHKVAGGKEREAKQTGKKRKEPGGPREQFRKFFHAEADDDAGVIEDYTHGIPQVLRLMNAEQLNNTTALVNRLMKADAKPEKVIEALYLRALSRPPTAAETARMTKYVAGEKDAARGYADVLWVLLNSSEFLLNH